jgi:formate hydrogenlyase subunit 6/NADH:ubiquinone oxidoreductase subunit I
MSAQNDQPAAFDHTRLPVWDDPREAMYRRVTIDPDRCDGCKLCVVVCPANVLELVGPKENLKARVKVDATGCMSCNNCFAVCVGQGVFATEPYDFAGYYAQMRIGEFLPPRRF